MEVDLPVHGLEPLEPLLACLVMYLLFLTAFWWVVRPKVIEIRKKRTLPRLLGRLAGLLFVLGVAALILVPALWALGALGVVGSLTAAVEALTAGASGVPLAIWAALIALLAFLLMLTSPLAQKRLPSRKK